MSERLLKIKKKNPLLQSGESGILLIGGPYNGQRVTVENKNAEVSYQGQYGIDTYYRVEIEDPSGEAAIFYRHSSLSDVIAVRELIRNYK